MLSIVIKTMYAHIMSLQQSVIVPWTQSSQSSRLYWLLLLCCHNLVNARWFVPSRRAHSRKDCPSNKLINETQPIFESIAWPSNKSNHFISYHIFTLWLYSVNRQRTDYGGDFNPAYLQSSLHSHVYFVDPRVCLMINWPIWAID